LDRNGINTIIDAAENRRRYRELARQTLNKFVLAYAKCPLEICFNREQNRGVAFGAPDRIHKKGLKGRSVTVSGLNVPHEAPLNADVVS
jgi:adenylylsulfate kinase-like enzyme